MARTKGSKNKNIATPSHLTLSPEERVHTLVNLVIDKIIEDQQNGQVLLKKIEGESCTVT